MPAALERVLLRSRPDDRRAARSVPFAGAVKANASDEPTLEALGRRQVGARRARNEDVDDIGTRLNVPPPMVEDHQLLQAPDGVAVRVEYGVGVELVAPSDAAAIQQEGVPLAPGEPRATRPAGGEPRLAGA